MRSSGAVGVGAACKPVSASAAPGTPGWALEKPEAAVQTRGRIWTTIQHLVASSVPDFQTVPIAAISTALDCFDLAVAALFRAIPSSNFSSVDFIHSR
jgi:hypothetical protein